MSEQANTFGLAPKGRRGARSALVWVGIAVSIGFTWLAVRNVSWSTVWTGLQNCSYWWLIPAIAAFVVSIFLKAIRWRYLFLRETRPPLEPVVVSVLVGYFFNQILPARAGEVARIVALRQTAGTSAAEATGTVLAERVYDVLVLLGMLFVVSPWLPHVTWLHAAELLAAAVSSLVAVTVVILAIFGAQAVHFALKPVTWIPGIEPEQVRSIGENLAAGLAGFRHIRIVLGAIFWTALGWLALAVSTWCVLIAFNLHLSLVAGILVVIATNLVMILPSSPSGIGVFEYAARQALTAYGIDQSVALSSALVIHILNFVPLVLAGLWAVRRSVKIAKRPPVTATPQPPLVASRTQA